MKQLFVLMLVFTFAGLVATARAADKPAANKPNPTGAWKWGVKFNDQTFHLTLNLKLEGDKLTGAMTGRNGDETPISDAKFKDGELSFSVVRESNGQSMTRKYAGKLTGDTIKGKSESTRNGQTNTRDWEAKRESSIAGTWKWTVDFGGETHNRELVLKNEGGKISGTLSGDDQKSDIRDAKFADGTLSYTVDREFNGQKMTFKYSGKVKGDAIEGKSQIERDGQSQSRDWTAKKRMR